MCPFGVARYPQKMPVGSASISCVGPLLQRRKRLEAQLRDFGRAPIRAKIVPPGRPPLHDRNRVAADGELEPDLVSQLRRNARVTEDRNLSFDLMSDGFWERHAEVRLCGGGSVCAIGRFGSAP